jgi:hypothetical protein
VTRCAPALPLSEGLRLVRGASLTGRNSLSTGISEGQFIFSVWPDAVGNGYCAISTTPPSMCRRPSGVNHPCADRDRSSHD